ncbi:MAG TPA: hypothetical protein VMT99_00730 [Candidatus Paceibacterota bacterium]|nr:hypothetical protein [Candidatus Paceibacterota bacterium]
MTNPKEWTLRLRAEDRGMFIDIRDGLKTVETRAATPRYRAIRKGDVLVFTCGRGRLRRKIARVRVFRTVGALAKAVPVRRVMPAVRSLGEMRTIYRGYPGYREKIRRYGIIAFDMIEL